MKHLRKFEDIEHHSVFTGYLSNRTEILDLCTELIDNDIRCEVSPLGSGSLRLEVNLDINLSQWARGYRNNIQLPEGNSCDSIKFFDLYKDKFNFVTNEISQITKRLESSGYKVMQFDFQTGSQNDYFRIGLQKELENHNEKIVVPVEVGDTIYMGRFKNKKTIVKEIGEDETGMPTINKKKVVTFKTTPPKKNPNFKGYNRWKKKKKED
jgi:hypothetical protein